MRRRGVTGAFAVGLSIVVLIAYVIVNNRTNTLTTNADQRHDVSEDVPLLEQSSPKFAEAHIAPLDPTVFIRRAEHEIDPGTARRLLKQDALPALYELLSDPEQKDDWPGIAKTICCLSDSPDQSARVVIDYVRRRDEWKPGTKEVHYGTLGKVHALQWLGMLDSELAQQTLNSALTHDGAKELAQAWLNGPLPVWAKTEQEDIVGVIQGMAAIGVVHSRDEQGIKQVRQAFEQAVRVRATMGFTPFYFSLLIEAVSIDDVIRDIGLDAYGRLLNEAEMVSGIQVFHDRYHAQMHQ